MASFKLADAHERQVIQHLLKYLFAAFVPDGRPFWPEWDSSLEQIWRCLAFFDPEGAENNGSYKPSRTFAEILACIEVRSMSDLPLVVDMVDVALKAAGFRWNTPTLESFRDVPSYPAELEEVLMQIGYMRPGQGVSADLAAILIHDYHFHRDGAALPMEVEVFVDNLARQTWLTASAEYRARLLASRTGAHAWTAGYFDHSWRFGRWLEEDEVARTHLTPNPNGALFWIVPQRICKGIEEGRLPALHM